VLNGGEKKLVCASLLLQANQWKKNKERARTEVEDIYIYIYDMWANAVSESRDLGFFFLSKNISKV
jgi:hypothetical protein